MIHLAKGSFNARNKNIIESFPAPSACHERARVCMTVQVHVLFVEKVFHRDTLFFPQKTVSRYFDVTIPSAQLYPTMISKVWFSHTGTTFHLLKCKLFQFFVSNFWHQRAGLQLFFPFETGFSLLQVWVIDHNELTTTVCQPKHSKLYLRNIYNCS